MDSQAVRTKEVRKYCPTCEEQVVFRLISREEEFNVRGERIVVENSVWQCPNCRTELFHEEFTKHAIRAAYAEYRRRKGIPTPEEIKALRIRLRLSQRDFAKLLGLEETAISRYENGALPSESDAAVITAIVQDPSCITGL